MDIPMYWSALFPVRLFLSISITVMLASCVSTDGRKTELAAKAPKKELSNADQKKIADYKAEVEIGRNMAGRLLEFYGVYEDKDLVGYVNEIAALLARYSDHPNRPYMLEIIKEKQANAFACPGGYILLTSGAIMSARSEAELAGIIAHELAHVGYEHMFSEIKRLEAEEKKKKEVKLTNIPASMKTRQRPKAEKSATGDLLAKYLSGSVAGLNILKAAGKGMDLILEQGLGAELELEADAKAINYLVNAGYNPQGYLDYLCRLETMRGKKKEDCYKQTEKTGKSQTVLDKTHPPVAQRLNALKQLIIKNDLSNPIGAIGQRRFIHYQAKMMREQASKK